MKYRNKNRSTNTSYDFNFKFDEISIQIGSAVCKIAILGQRDTTNNAVVSS